MGSSRSRGFFSGRKPEEIKLYLRKEEEKTLDQAFEAQVAEGLGDLLSDANQRDAKAIGDAVDEIKDALAADIEGTVDPIFGGSVRKRTFVDGISDIDTLVILRDPKLRSLSPQEVLTYFEKKARAGLPGWGVSRGKREVTLTRDGVELQGLPAAREASTTRIRGA